jgi:hypothetical protein
MTGIEIIGLSGLMFFSYTIGSLRIIKQGSEALVERFGRYHRKLKPGINFIVPVIDKIVETKSVKETFMTIKNHRAVSANGFSLEIDLIIYWRLLESELTYYAVDDAKASFRELAISFLNEAVWNTQLHNPRSRESKFDWDDCQRYMLSSLDEATEPWGIKIVRVHIQRAEYVSQPLDPNVVSVVFDEGIDWTVFENTLAYFKNLSFETIGGDNSELTVKGIKIDRDNMLLVDLYNPNAILGDRFLTNFLRHYYTHLSSEVEPSKAAYERRLQEKMATFEGIINVLAYASDS